MVIIKAMGNPISKTRVTSRDVRSGIPNCGGTAAATSIAIHTTTGTVIPTP